MLNSKTYKTEITKGVPQGYSLFLEKYKSAIIFQSAEYYEYIAIQTQSELEFICLKNEDELIGVYPLFFKLNRNFGLVCNSAPYFGSHGGPLVIDELKDRDTCIKVLHQKAIDYCKVDKKCLVFTAITHPLDTAQAEIISEHFPTTHNSWRYGQMTSLPVKGEENIEEQVMTFYHYKKRNDIRKAIKNGVECYQSEKDEDFEFLYDLQYKNMTYLGAKPKEKSFFMEIKSSFKNKHYKLYIATKNGEKIGGILFFTDGIAFDYYCPAFKVEYRNLQPSALLIYRATVDAVKEGYIYFNWGGTAENLTHIYSFKNEWGATDFKYHYFSYIFDKSVLKKDPKELAEAYPSFYLFPY